MKYKIITGDCLEEMRKMESNSISAIVTDPPYGLGFMGKKWDAGLPQEEIWKEALRIGKPGAFLLSFGGTRTYHRLACAIEDSGWEIRDCIMWIYGSGFPKSHNHFEIEGYGTALKPAYEPIIMAMKPLDGTFKYNAKKWGQAGINIDGCRIYTKEDRSRPFGPQNEANTYCKGWRGDRSLSNALGRWPANVIIDEESGKLLDEQSGITKSTSNERKNSEFKSVAKGKEYAHSTFGHSDSGGASRFFYCAKASSSERNEGLDELTLKNNSGCYGKFVGDGRGRQTEHIPQRNNHPTVKPLKLMEYLIKLVMPPSGGILLDPFAGSGTTILAAKKLGFDATGIEKSEEYCAIAKERLKI